MPKKTLRDNYNKCIKMDEALRIDSDVTEDDDDEEAAVEVKLSGRKHYNCPIYKCRTKNYGIRRHLETCYSSETIDYGVDCAKL